GVELLVAGQEVVGAHDRRVAAHVAATEITLFEHGDVGDAVVLRKVVGGGQTMPAAADDDDLVFLLRRGVAPCGRPAPVAREPLADDPEPRIAHRPLRSRTALPLWQ